MQACCLGMRLVHSTSEFIRVAAGCPAGRASCATVLGDAEAPRIDWHDTKEGRHEKYSRGLLTRRLLGLVVTLKVRVMVSGVEWPKSTSGGQVLDRRVVLAALVRRPSAGLLGSGSEGSYRLVPAGGIEPTA